MQTSPATEATNAGLIRRFALTSTIAIYLQIILGAAIRHSESGVLAHIMGAAAVFGCVIASVVVILFTLKQKEFLLPAVLLLGLVAAQIALGLVTFMVRVPKNADGQLSAIQIVVPTLHLALGALILATSLAIALKSYRFLALPREDTALPFAAGALS
jgi:heme A synthase